MLTKNIPCHIIKAVRKNVRINKYGGVIMTSVNITNLRENLYSYANNILNYGDNLEVRTKQGDIVMMSKNEYSNLMGTLYLMSLPGTWKEIKEGLDTDLKDCISENEAQNQQEEMTYEKLIKSEDFYPHHFELYKEYGQPIRCRSEIEKFHERFGDGYKVYELFPKQVENEGFITYKVIYYCKFKSNIG